MRSIRIGYGGIGACRGRASSGAHAGPTPPKIPGVRCTGRQQGERHREPRQVGYDSRPMPDSHVGAKPDSHVGATLDRVSRARPSATSTAKQAASNTNTAINKSTTCGPLKKASMWVVSRSKRRVQPYNTRVDAGRIGHPHGIRQQQPRCPGIQGFGDDDQSDDGQPQHAHLPQRPVGAMQEKE
jgi:hypothetical protein